MKTKILTIICLALGLVASSCSRSGLKLGSYDSYSSPDSSYGANGGNGNGQYVRPTPGVMTAAEWNDLMNWSFWGNLMSGNYARYNTLFGLNTSKRVSVSAVTEAGDPVKGVPVKLMYGEQVCWETITDIYGQADLWLAVENSQDPISISDCTLSIDGQVVNGTPEIWPWNAETPVINKYTITTSAPQQLSNVDIAFIVDATGSMSDEINFLKADLLDILQTVQSMETNRSLFVGSVFYRDEDGDEYLTRSFSFTSDFTSAISFVKEQNADGGGDFPEAVHKALEVGLQDLQWHSNAYSKIAFMFLDAPAHYDSPQVITSIQKSIRSYAAKGIKIIPVLCSTEGKETEFMCREFAILTGGTYVFVTDDSGVGNDHEESSVGEYQLEKLNDLIVRLITKYIK